ncbi:MAG: glycosyltransferase family 2 protein [Bacteroidales bacterium]|nr:glycosyltransferase family 2 protein [Bacteroidales bacterium]
MNQIAILIPIFNGLEFTKKCLSNLYGELARIKLNDIVFQVIIIDDGSTDGSNQWIKSNYSNATILQGNGNLWWSGGINLGAKYAIEKLDVDFILLWNNDITAINNYFQVLAREISNKSIKANEIIGSKIYSDFEAKQIWSLGGVFNSRTGAKYMFGQSKPEDTIDLKDFSPDWLPGMGTLVPVKIIKDIGFWDAKNFPQYFGDSEFTLRAKCKGYRLRILQDLQIINDISNSTLRHQNSLSGLIRTFYDRKSMFSVKYHLRFYRKYATSPLAYLSLINSYFRYIGGFLKWKVLGMFGIYKK